jgi:hypothetical protein
MELTIGRLRPIAMTHSRKARNMRGLITAGMLTAALAGCGTYVAGASQSSDSGSAGAASSTTATGCASVNDATKVTVIRAMHLVEPARAAALEVTQTKPAVVRALFHDLCQVVSHKDTSGAVHSCPMDIGLSYGGAFYDGSRELASYTFAASGCEVVTVTPASKGAKPESAIVMGSAAAAAPQLHSDMDKAVGLSDAEVFRPENSATPAAVNQGSGDSK